MPSKEFSQGHGYCTGSLAAVLTLGLLSSSFLAISLITVPLYVLIALPGKPTLMVLISSYGSYLLAGLWLSSHKPNKWLLRVIGGKAMNPMAARRVRAELPKVLQQCSLKRPPSRIRLYQSHAMTIDPMGGDVLRLSRRSLALPRRQEFAAVLAREAAPLAQAVPMGTGMGIWLATPAMYLYERLLRFTYHVAAGYGPVSPVVRLLKYTGLAIFGGLVAFRRCLTLTADQFAARHGYADDLVAALRQEVPDGEINDYDEGWHLDVASPSLRYRVNRLQRPQDLAKKQITFRDDPAMLVAALPIVIVIAVMTIPQLVG